MHLVCKIHQEIESGQVQEQSWIAIVFSHLATQLVISSTLLCPTPSTASKLVVCFAMHANSKDSSEMLNGV